MVGTVRPRRARSWSKPRAFPITPVVTKNPAGIRSRARIGAAISQLFEIPVVERDRDRGTRGIPAKGAGDHVLDAHEGSAGRGRI